MDADRTGAPQGGAARVRRHKYFAQQSLGAGAIHSPRAYSIPLGWSDPRERNPKIRPSAKGRWSYFWRSGWDSNPREVSLKLISSLVRTWYFRVCCGRWRQFWKRRKSLCCNGFRTRRPVLPSSISEKTRVQIEIRNAPKRSIFLRAGKKIRKKKTLVRYGFADSHPD